MLPLGDVPIFLCKNFTPKFFSAINRGDIKDTEIEAIIDSIVDSLFSVFVNLGKSQF